MPLDLTPMDDLIGHQVAAPFTLAGNGDPRFTERYWYSGHPIDGSELMIDVGLGYYPNRGVMDAFGGITAGRKQHNFRASRQLGANPLETAVGPLRIEVLEGMKRHRLTLGPSDAGIAFDFEFQATFPASRETQSFRERDGKVEEDMLRIMQFGRLDGWLEVEGRRVRMEPSTWWGQRDHSWGIRPLMRTDESAPPVMNVKNYFWTWSTFQFDNMGLSIYIKERDPGKPSYVSGEEVTRLADGSLLHRRVTHVTHDIRWRDDPLGQTLDVAEFVIDFAEGPPRRVTMTGDVPRFYLKGGLYGGFAGWNHGDDRGGYHASHDSWMLDHAETRAAARTLSDHVVHATTDGLVGHGVSEYGVATGYARYPAQQRFPAF
jgi:hypothetical protein